MKQTNETKSSKMLVQAGTYVLSGNLKGEIDPEFLENLPKGTKVRLYKVTQEASYDLKLSTRIVDEKELIALQRSFFAEGEIDQNGDYQVEMSNNQYPGGPFVIGVYLKTVPYKKPDKKSYDPILVLLGAIEPEWIEDNRRDDFAVARFSHIFSKRFWCLVREYFNAWVICGRVCDAETGAGVAGAQVRACDKDLIQDDLLGEVETDVSGYFRIDYATNDFRKTPIPGLFLENVPGPDVYFRVEFGGETPIDEPRNMGLTPGRRDIGRCFYIKFRIKAAPGGPPIVNPSNTFFDEVGNYDIDTQFTADGLGKLTPSAREMAFYATVKLKGSLPNGNTGSVVKYRFMYQWMNPVTNVFTAAEPITRNMIALTRIGSKVVYNPGPPANWTQSPFYLNPALSSAPATPLIQAGETWMDNAGWVEVPQDATNMYFDAGEVLVKLNTQTLTTIGDGLLGQSSQHDMGTYAAFQAGSDVPTSSESPSHTFRIVFQAEVDGNPLPEDTLDKIVISNTLYTYFRHPNWAGSNPTTRPIVSLNIAELLGGSACSDLANTMTVRYTVYHPHLHAASLNLKGQDTSGVTLPSIIIAANGESKAVVPVNISALDPCAYLLELVADLNLTTGESKISNHEDEIAFCRG